MPVSLRLLAIFLPIISLIIILSRVAASPDLDKKEDENKMMKQKKIDENQFLF